MWANTKAHHNYIIEAKKEAGIILRGDEVKSVRQHGLSLSGCYGVLQEGRFWLYGLTIQQYRFSSRTDRNTERPKELLLKKQELKKWWGSVREKGRTLIPLRAYFNERGILKCEVGLCTGKTKYDKRRAEREKELRREIDTIN
jgi:SsrA-binding protein